MRSSNSSRVIEYIYIYTYILLLSDNYMIYAFIYIYIYYLFIYFHIYKYIMLLATRLNVILCDHTCSYLTFSLLICCVHVVHYSQHIGAMLPDGSTAAARPAATARQITLLWISCRCCIGARSRHEIEYSMWRSSRMQSFSIDKFKPIN